MTTPQTSLRFAHFWLLAALVCVAGNLVVVPDAWARDPWMRDFARQPGATKAQLKAEQLASDVGDGEDDEGTQLAPEAAAELKNGNGGSWVPDLRDDVGPDAAAAGGLGGISQSLRAATRDARYTVKAGETLRTIAYRYCTSPVAVALVNNLPFDAQHEVTLRPGQTISIPIQFRAPVGFKEGEQLTSGPGLLSQKTDGSNWGRPQMVHMIRNVFRDMQKHWPRRHPALVGSLSREHGGRLGHHKSHRSGQDVDIGYLTQAATRAQWGVPGTDEIDWQRMWFVVDSLERTGQIAAIYMAPVLQRKLYQYAAEHGESEARLQHLFQYGPKGSRGDTLIRFAAGHRDHFHVRFVTSTDFGGKES